MNCCSLVACCAAAEEDSADVALLVVWWKEFEVRACWRDADAAALRMREEDWVICVVSWVPSLGSGDDLRPSSAGRH